MQQDVGATMPDGQVGKGSGVGISALHALNLIFASSPPRIVKRWASDARTTTRQKTSADSIPAVGEEKKKISAVRQLWQNRRMQRSEKVKASLDVISTVSQHTTRSANRRPASHTSTMTELTVNRTDELAVGRSTSGSLADGGILECPPPRLNAGPENIPIAFFAATHVRPDGRRSTVAATSRRDGTSIRQNTLVLAVVQKVIEPSTQGEKIGPEGLGGFCQSKESGERGLVDVQVNTGTGGIFSWSRCCSRKRFPSKII